MSWLSATPLLLAQAMSPASRESMPAISPDSLKALADLIKAVGGSGAHQGGFSAEYIKALADLISAVAWPIAAIVCVTLFRRQLVALIGSVQTVKVFGAEISLKIKQELDQSAQEASTATGLSTAPSAGELARAVVVERLVSDVDIAVVKRQAEELAEEYERTRHSMQPGNERTRRMEVVISKMRTIGRAFYSLRNEFANSPSPGRRLMAVAALQVDPDYDMLDWLSNRLSVESPFVGYHALVALLLAVRAPGAKAHLPAIKVSVEKARQSKGVIGNDTDRIRVLADVETALDALSRGETSAFQS